MLPEHRDDLPTVETADLKILWLYVAECLADKMTARRPMNKTLHLRVAGSWGGSFNYVRLINHHTRIGAAERENCVQLTWDTEGRQRNFPPWQQKLADPAMLVRSQTLKRIAFVSLSQQLF